MKAVQQKKVETNSNTVNTIVAGIAGAVAGSIAVATALVMSDKKNQKKAKDAYVDAKGKVTKYIDSITSQPIIKKGVHAVGEVVSDIKQKIENKE